MSTVSAAQAGQPARGVREFLHRRPEAGAATVVAAAWIVLVLLAADGARMSSPSGVQGMSGMPGIPEGMGMGMGMGMAPVAAVAPVWTQAASGLPFWVLMTIAMMGPAALAGIRHTAVNTLSWRRRRAMAEFAAAYLLVWAGFGFLVLAAAARLPPGDQVFWLSAALAAAAAWQLTPVKRRALRGCHRSVPLRPRGWRAEAAALRFGLRNGTACLGSCWCLMLVMAVAPAEQLLWTAGLTAIVTAEKLGRWPRGTTQAAAIALTIAALVALAAAAAGG